MEPPAEDAAGGSRLGTACVRSGAEPWSLPRSTAADGKGTNFPPQLLPPQLLPDKIATEVAERVAEVVQPILSQAKESQDSLVEVEQALNSFVRRFETALEGERQLAEGRLQRHELFLQRHAERMATASSAWAREVAAPTTGATQPPPAGSGLGSVEASLERLEAAVTRQQRAIEEVTTQQQQTTRMHRRMSSILDTDYSNDMMWSPVPSKASDFRNQRGPSNLNMSSDSVADSRKATELQADGDCGPTPRGEPDETSEEVHRRGSTLTVDTSALFAADNQFHTKQVKRRDTTMTQMTIDLGSDTTAEGTTILGMPMEEVKSLTSQNRRRRRASSVMQNLLTDYVIQSLEWWESLREPPRRGELSKLIKSRSFEAFCGIVILANSVFIVYTTNQKMFGVEREETDVMMPLIGELIFLCWYTIELLLKLVVHRLYFFVGMDCAWNIFDLSLVVVAIYFELFGFLLTGNGGSGNTIALRVLRVLRLVKVLRSVRLLRYLTFFSAARLILHALLGSCMSLFWGVALMLFVCYLFAVVFVESMTDYLLAGNADPVVRADIARYFGSVQACIVTLFKATFHGTDWDIYYQVLVRTEGFNGVMFLAFVGLMQVALLNVVTATFVEVALRLAAPDTHTQAHQKRIKERQEAKELRSIVAELDTEGKGVISAWQFQELVSNSHMRHCMAVLGLDVRNTEDFFDMLGFISGNSEVDIDDFVQGCMRMRGAATGLGQQSLLMEAKLLRRAQRDLCLIMTERIDMLQDRVQALAPVNASSSPPKGVLN